MISGNLSKNGYVWVTQWPTSSELKIKFYPSLYRSSCEFFKIIKNHGPTNSPWGCNLGPKWHSLSWHSSDFCRQSVQSIYIVVLALGGMIAGFILWNFYIVSYNIAEKIRKSYVKKFRPPTPVQNLRNHLQAYYVLSIYILYIGRKL